MTLLLLSLLACFGDKPEPETTDTTPTVPTGPGPTQVVEEGISNLTVTPSDVYPNIFTVEWDTEAAGTSLVQWGPTTAYGRITTPSTSTSTHHAVLVVGAKPQSTVHFRVVSQIDGVDYGSTDQTFDAGAGENTTPELDVDDVRDGAFTSGFRGVATQGDRFGVQLADDDGEAVWWRGYDDTGFHVIVQARFSADGTQVSYMINDVSRTEDVCTIETERLDGTPVASARCEWGHHDFDLLPDGRVAYLYADIRPYRGDDVVGDAVVVMDLDGGNVTEIWNAWDELQPDDNIFENDPFYPDALDWTHGNSLNYDPGTDSLVLSLHNLNTVYNLDLDGTLNWSLGDVGTVSIQRESDGFIHQHGAKMVPGTTTDVVLFDNGENGDRSEVSRYTIDFGSNRATRSWNTNNGGQYSSFILGDALVVGDGNYFTSWGSEGEVTEFDADGEVVWRGAGELGTTTGYASFHTTIGGVLE